MIISEEAIRAKVIELLDGMNQHRMDLWLWSGIAANVFTPQAFEKVLKEEMPNRSASVQTFWNGPCNCCGQLN